MIFRRKFDSCNSIIFRTRLKRYLSYFNDFIIDAIVKKITVVSISTAFLIPFFFLFFLSNVLDTRTNEFESAIRVSISRDSRFPEFDLYRFYNERQKETVFSGVLLGAATCVQHQRELLHRFRQARRRAWCNTRASSQEIAMKIPISGLGRSQVEFTIVAATHACVEGEILPHHLPLDTRKRSVSKLCISASLIVPDYYYYYR